MPDLARDRERARELGSKGAFIERLRALFEDSGCAIEAVADADDAWAAGAASACPDSDEMVCAVQLSAATRHARLLGISRGRLTRLRRLPLAESPTAVGEALGQLASSWEAPRSEASAVPVLALGDAQFRSFIDTAAVGAGLRSVEPIGVVAGLECEPEAVAASFAGAGPRWVPNDVVAAARARNRRRAALSVAVATLLLVVCAVFDTLDLRRELDAIRALRVERAGPVAELMEARAAAAELEVALLNLEELRRDLPRWTVLFSSLGAGLPESAHLTSLRAAGDSLYLELEGSDVSAAFDAVRGIPWLEGFRSIAPVQRELGDARGLTERLTASATVSWVDLNSAQ